MFVEVLRMFVEVLRCSSRCCGMFVEVLRGCSSRCCDVRRGVADVRRGVAMFVEVLRCSSRCCDVRRGVAMFVEVLGDVRRGVADNWVEVLRCCSSRCCDKFCRGVAMFVASCGMFVEVLRCSSRCCDVRRGVAMFVSRCLAVRRGAAMPGSRCCGCSSRCFHPKDAHKARLVCLPSVSNGRSEVEV